jgi:molybdopterin-guanine dinucleotide biosynthesis protein A
MTRMTLTALLLAGGESRRMGRDKSTIEIDGEPLWQHQLRILRDVKPEQVLVSARMKPGWLPADMALLLDDFPSRGPLSGLVKALAAMSTTHLIALAVDMPFMTGEELNRLCRLRQPACGVVPVIDRQAEPLAAIYPAEALPDFANALTTANSSLQPIVGGLSQAGKVRLYRVPMEDAYLYRSVNAPGDLEFDA